MIKKSVYLFFNNCMKNKHFTLNMSKQVKSIFIAVFCIFFLNSCKSKQDDNDLGFFNSPEEAFEFTCKTLNFISIEINNGMKSANYINEYHKIKLTIFKDIKHE